MPQLQKRFLLVSGAALLAGHTAFAQPPEGDAKAGVRADAARITVGDQVKVFLNVQHDPASSSIEWPMVPDTVNGLEIVEKGKIDTQQSGGLRLLRQRLLVTGFDSGMFVLPAFQVPVMPKRGSPYILRTEPVSLLVQTVAVDTTQPFRPIKEIIAVKTTWRDYLWLILGGLALVFLAIAGIWYFRKRRKVKPPVTPAAPPETLQEKTLRLLTTLEGEQLWQRGQVKEYYVRLTDIVRGYIESRFDTPALELTTDELLGKTRTFPPLIPVAGPLQTILHTADLAKFAKAEPLPEEHVAAMDAARSLITATPSPAAPDPSKQP